MGLLWRNSYPQYHFHQDIEKQAVTEDRSIIVYCLLEAEVVNNNIKLGHLTLCDCSEPVTSGRLRTIKRILHHLEPLENNCPGLAEVGGSAE
jgi:hypothetical protein